MFRIDLNGATDVSGIDLDAPARRVHAGHEGSAETPWLDLALPATLAHASLAALNGVSPEKWEGLAVGPQLADGSYLVLAGTDNDYSVTQNLASGGLQFDRYFKPMGTAVERIQCDIGTFNNCARSARTARSARRLRRASTPAATSSCPVCCTRTKRRRQTSASSCAASAGAPEAKT